MVFQKSLCSLLGRFVPFKSLLFTIGVPLCNSSGIDRLCFCYLLFLCALLLKVIIFDFPLDVSHQTD